jgi:hypothetical protein
VLPAAISDRYPASALRRPNVNSNSKGSVEDWEATSAAAVTEFSPMFVAASRPLLLVLCTASTFVVLGRAPGAVNLRTRDIETVIAAEGRAGREIKSSYVWFDPAAM